MLFVTAGWFFFLRVQNWERGQPDRRATTAGTSSAAWRDLRSGLYMQTLLRDPAAGIMHSLIYFPFLILFAVTTVDEINHLLPGERQVPARHRVPGATRSWPTRPASCS